jgi:hypothetical protein
VQQRKQRGQLRHDGVIVVAGIGEELSRNYRDWDCNLAPYFGALHNPTEGMS